MTFISPRAIARGTAVCAIVAGLGAATMPDTGTAQPDKGCPWQFDLCSEGVAITGNNNLRGKTVFSFDGVGAVTFGQFVGVWNPGGALPGVIDADTPDEVVLATIAPPGFPLYNPDNPNTPLSFPIPGQNLRFQDVPTVNAPTGAVAAVPFIGDAGLLTPAFGPLKSDYTLGQWLAAKGELKMRCPSNDLTEVRMELEGLVPNGGVYTMWAFWNNNGSLAVIPFAGSGTNSFTTDRDGAAELDFTIPLCVLDDFVDGDSLVNLVAVQLDFHSDDGLTGVVPNLPLVPFRGPGIIGHSALIFPIRAQSCEEAGDCRFAQ